MAWLIVLQCNDLALLLCNEKFYDNILKREQNWRQRYIFETFFKKLKSEMKQTMQMDSFWSYRSTSLLFGISGCGRIGKGKSEKCRDNFNIIL